VIVSDGDDRVLLIRRTGNGNYSPPGGALDLRWPAAVAAALPAQL
jgi:ADP-ribose pyrophosphatase YjhB (NUDIX family)